MPMIDVYAAAGTFGDPHALAQKLASELMAIEQVPDIPMFRQNTAAFVHELPSSGISNVEGDSTYVRIQVLTNAGALDRAKQTGGRVPLLDDRWGNGRRLFCSRSGRGSCSPRQPRAGWGLAGHANTNEELVAAARAQIAELQSKGRPEA